MSSISPKSAKELYQILSFLSENDFKKIPGEEIEYIERIKDNNYITNINSMEDINSNNIMEETQKYLAYIFLNYLATEEEKIEYREILKENEKRYQKELEEKYDITKIFEKRNKKINNTREQEKSLTVIKNKSLLEIILEKLRKIFIKK